MGYNNITLKEDTIKLLDTIRDLLKYPFDNDTIINIALKREIARINKEKGVNTSKS